MLYIFTIAKNRTSPRGSSTIRYKTHLKYTNYPKSKKLKIFSFFIKKHLTILQFYKFFYLF